MRVGMSARKRSIRPMDSTAASGVVSGETHRYAPPLRTVMKHPRPAPAGHENGTAVGPPVKIALMTAWVGVVPGAREPSAEARHRLGAERPEPADRAGRVLLEGHHVRARSDHLDLGERVVRGAPQRLQRVVDRDDEGAKVCGETNPAPPAATETSGSLTSSS